MKKTINQSSVFVVGIILIVLFRPLDLSAHDITKTNKTATEKTDSTTLDSLEAKAQVAEIEIKKCIKCGICAKVCPEKAITIIRHQPIVNHCKCTGCGECANQCPTRAIFLTEKETKDDTLKTNKEEKTKDTSPVVR
jgi:ferredoxin